MTRTPKLLALAVAALLALTACGGDDGGTDDGADAGGGDAPAGTVQVTGNEALEFTDTSLTASAGTLTVELTCEGAAPHTFLVEGETESAVAVCNGDGDTGSGTVELPAGEYTFFCDVAGHREAGMEGTLTVEG